MSKKTLVIVAHPDITQSRINRTWIEALSQHKDQITVHELYATYPDGKIDVAAEQNLVETHDRIIFQFPLFWFSSPSLLKQWFDSVLAYGWAFGPDGRKVAGKEIGVAVSTGGLASSYQAGGQNQYTLSEILRPIQGTANFIGATYLPLHALQGGMYGLTDEDLQANAKDYVALALA